MAKSKIKRLGMQWGFSELWNESLRSLPERPMVKREHIWASELSGDFTTRYLKMHAHPYTNPFNDRSRRKFIAGHIWEWIVGLILTMCGVLKAQQLRGEIQLPGLLMVSGKLDFIAGGEVDWEKAKAEVKRIQQMFALSVGEVPPIIFYAADRILARMEMMFTRVPLKKIVLECKSVSSFVSDLIEKTGKPRPGHDLQILHYILANPEETDEGMLLYINKDSCLCTQFEITPTSGIIKTYNNDVKQMTEYFRSSGRDYLKNIPTPEPEVNFVDGSYRFVKNYHAEYSPYLTMLYGYKDFDQFKNYWQSRLGSWNRVFKRVVTGENITPSNSIIIKEVVKVFPEWDLYVKKAKKANAFAKPEDNDDDA